MDWNWNWICILLAICERTVEQPLYTGNIIDTIAKSPTDTKSYHRPPVITVHHTTATIRRPLIDIWLNIISRHYRSFPLSLIHPPPGSSPLIRYHTICRPADRYTKRTTDRRHSHHHHRHHYHHHHHHHHHRAIRFSGTTALTVDTSTSHPSLAPSPHHHHRRLRHHWSPPAFTNRHRHCHSTNTTRWRRCRRHHTATTTIHPYRHHYPPTPPPPRAICCCRINRYLVRALALS